MTHWQASSEGMLGRFGIVPQSAFSKIDEKFKELTQEEQIQKAREIAQAELEKHKVSKNAPSCITVWYVK